MDMLSSILEGEDGRRNGGEAEREAKKTGRALALPRLSIRLERCNYSVSSDTSRIRPRLSNLKKKGVRDLRILVLLATVWCVVGRLRGWIRGGSSLSSPNYQVFVGRCRFLKWERRNRRVVGLGTTHVNVLVRLNVNVPDIRTAGLTGAFTFTGYHVGIGLTP